MPNSIPERDGVAIHVAVMMGGPSSEHDVSIKSGTAVANSLKASGLRVIEVPFREAVLPPLPPIIDVVFPALHGTFGEDGTLQRLLEERGIPFVGSDARASHTIMDKQRTKAVLHSAGIPVPFGSLLRQPTAKRPASLDFPIILKPNHGGSTIGLAVVNCEEEWERRLREALAHGDDVVAERFLTGIEVTAGLLDGVALPVIEIVPPSGLFDYDAKYVYSRGKTAYLCPPHRLGAAAQAEVQRLARETYRVLGARDLLRVDMIWDKVTDSPYILEANSMPGFTPQSLLPKAAAAADIPFDELCVRLVRMALDRTQ